MNNTDTKAAWDYHNDTKHSEMSFRTVPHFLDWENQPRPFKLYEGLGALHLPSTFGASSKPALEALDPEGLEFEAKVIPDLPALAKIFYFSAGITKKKTFDGGGEILFRAASCTGALYHIELYLACGDLPGLRAGLYHFGPSDFALRRLRVGDWRPLLVQASGNEPSLARAPAIVILTTTFWRNAWKYRARAYRHAFWDGGTLLANVLAVAGTKKIPAKLVMGFADEPVNQLLDVETEREVALGLVSLGQTETTPAGPPETPEGLNLKTLPLSRAEVDYPAIREMHQASCLHDPDETGRWRVSPPEMAPPQPAGRQFPLKPLEAELPTESLEEVIRRRGSSRQFARLPISFAQLSTILDRCTRGIPADGLEPFGSTVNELYLIVNDVEGLPAGAYYYHRGLRALEQLREGDFRKQAGYLDLGQALAADAAVNIYTMTSLEPVLSRYGNRGYRLAQLEGGIIGGRIYLAAYAQRLGATGLTFFDDDVTEFFSPHAEGKSVMFLMAVGRSARRKVLAER